MALFKESTELLTCTFCNSQYFVAQIMVTTIWTGVLVSGLSISTVKTAEAIGKLKFVCQSSLEFNKNPQIDFTVVTKNCILLSEMTLTLNFPVINASGLKKRKPRVGPLLWHVLPQSH